MRFVTALSKLRHANSDPQMYADMAKKIGHVTVIGDGSNRWPAVHRLDAAVLFRLALEKGTAGATYHAVSEQGVPMKDILDIVGKKTQLPVKSKTMEEAVSESGFLAYVFCADNPASSAKTQKELGWNIKGSRQPDLLTDLKEIYF